MRHTAAIIAAVLVAACLCLYALVAAAGKSV